MPPLYLQQERSAVTSYELAPAPEALRALPTTHIQGKLAIRVH